MRLSIYLSAHGYTFDAHPDADELIVAVPDGTEVKPVRFLGQRLAFLPSDDMVSFGFKASELLEMADNDSRVREVEYRTAYDRLREAKVTRLRGYGATMRELAAALGVGVATVHRVQRRMAKVG